MKIDFDQRTTPELLAVDETLLTTQNGYLGVRGCFEEDTPYKSHRGTYLNGVYDTTPIHYEENAFGFPQTSETILNLPDAQTIKIFVDCEPIDLKSAKILDLKRAFDTKKGIVTRSVLYETKQGFQLWFHTKRLAHLKYLPLFMIDMTIESVNYEGSLDIGSVIETRVTNLIDNEDMRLGHHTLQPIVESMGFEDQIGIVKAKTSQSQIDLITLMHHSDSFDLRADDSMLIAEKTIDLNKGMSYRFQKKVVYLHSLETQDLKEETTQWKTLLNTLSYEELYETQTQAIDQLNPYMDITIDANTPSLNESIQYALYQLYTSGAYSQHVNIPAKGLTGEGYQGHTFWDTEIYMMPFFMQMSQENAKHLLLNRFNQLGQAKHEANLLGAKEGVKFAWRTITGRESSAYFLASTAQYHINSDIAYAIIQYDLLYQDATFMHKHGIKILIETARFFKSIVHDYHGHYHLHGVTGPDEYNALVDDNYYTNSMLKYHLNYLIQWVKNHDYHIDKEELRLFQDIEERLYLGFDKTLNIDVQDRSFLSKKPLNYEAIPDEQKPWLLSQHPLTIYRHQILKQADTILSHFLLHNRPIDIMQASMAFYEPKTTHDSSLSYCIHSAQYAKLNQIDKAYEYFMKTLRLDLDNTHKNTFHGLHVANLGGIYLGLLYGFMGYEIKESIHLYPRLPKEWRKLVLTCRLIKEGSLKITLTHTDIQFEASKDARIYVHDSEVQLVAYEPLTIHHSWF